MHSTVTDGLGRSSHLNRAVFLARQDEIRLVRAGDVLDGRYRVSAVSRARVDFIYLPLNASQSLLTGALP